MNEEFEKLFSTLSEKDQKEVANLIRFKNEVKYHDKQFEELLQQYIELSREHDKLQNNWDDLKKFVNRYYDYYMNNEDFIGGRLCFTDIKNKIQELEQGKDDN